MPEKKANQAPQSIEVSADLLEAMAQLAGYHGDRLNIMEKIKTPADTTRREKLFRGYFEAINFIKSNPVYGQQELLNAVRENNVTDGEVMLALSNYGVLQEQDPSKRFELFVAEFFK